MNLKDRIITEAGRLFIQQGVKGTSMDEIATNLGISKRTIYQNFKDKEDLLLYYIRFLEKLHNDYLQEVSKNEETVVHIFLRSIDMHKELEFLNVKFIDDVDKYYLKAKKELEEQRVRGVESIRKFLKLGIEQEVIREQINIEVVSYLLEDNNRSFLNATRIANKSFTNWELFFTSMINFIRGISTTKGIEIVDEFLEEYSSNKNA